MIGKVGDDGFGRFLEENMRSAGVDTRGVLFDPAVPTTLAFVHLAPSGDRSFSFYRSFFSGFSFFFFRFFRIYGNLLFAFFSPLESYDAGYTGKKGIVAASGNVGTGQEFGAALADDNFPSINKLGAIAFNA